MTDHRVQDLLLHVQTRTYQIAQDAYALFDDDNERLSFVLSLANSNLASVVKLLEPHFPYFAKLPPGRLLSLGVRVQGRWAGRAW